MCVLPDTEERQTEITCHRNGRYKQPLPGRRERCGKRTNQRIKKEQQRESCIQSGATGADGELVSSNEERPLGELMAESAKCAIDCEGKAVMTTDSQRSGDDEPTKQQRAGRDDQPRNKWSARCNELGSVLVGWKR